LKAALLSPLYSSGYLDKYGNAEAALADKLKKLI
jgi:hypothetical protein